MLQPAAPPDITDIDAEVASLRAEIAVADAYLEELGKIFHEPDKRMAKGIGRTVLVVQISEIMIRY